MTNDSFWFEDMTVLLYKDNLSEFIPLVEMTDEEKLNAVVRFCLYLSVLLILFTNNINYVFIAIGALIITYTIYTIHKKQNTDLKAELLNEIDGKYKKYLDKNEDIDIKKAEPLNTQCLKPSADNIFANNTINSLNKKEINSCEPNVLEKQMNEHIANDQFVESGKLFEDKMSLRQFYKVPNQFDSDSRKQFLEWCYKPPN